MAVELTDIFNQKLTLTVDPFGFWLLADDAGNDLFIQSEDQQYGVGEDDEPYGMACYLIIRPASSRRYRSMVIHLKGNDLTPDTYDVRISSDDWGMAIGTL